MGVATATSRLIAGAQRFVAVARVTRLLHENEADFILAVSVSDLQIATTGKHAIADPPLGLCAKASRPAPARALRACVLMEWLIGCTSN